ncbi:SHC SH2 domain-binding protein 1 homolog B-like [Amphiura filiformis]|uniref:SHC SH2 domain-binding protein 1 homolog B-like n=1 Tax=Amphiura filiformis TaxID=82378 RepID=UPI003B21F36F
MEKAVKKQKTGATKAIGTANGHAGASNSTSMPATYPALDVSKTFDERWHTLINDAITDCKPCEVESGFEYYINEYVQNEDWKAVWKSHQFGCDVVVEVKDVCFPHAKVEIVEPLCCVPNSLGDFDKAGGDGLQLKTKDDLTKFLSDGNGKVPLLELLPILDESGDLDEQAEVLEPILDESGDLDEQAEVLELYRFFYTYIWRATDDHYGDGDYDFSMFHLQPRMKIYYDVQKKKASKAVVESYNKIMPDYEKKHWQFKIKHEVYRGEEADGKELQKLWVEICELEKQLEKLTYKYYKGMY